MNPYYQGVPPVPPALPNAYYYPRRQPPPAAIPHTPPPTQPNPFAPPYIPIAALQQPPPHLLPLQHLPSHYSPRPPTIVSSTQPIFSSNHTIVSSTQPTVSSAPPIVTSTPPIVSSTHSLVAPPILLSTQPIVSSNQPLPPQVPPHQRVPSPPPPAPIPSLAPASASPVPEHSPQAPAPISSIPSYPPYGLPWLSCPDQPFPERPRRRRGQIIPTESRKTSSPPAPEPLPLSEPIVPPPTSDASSGERVIEKTNGLVEVSTLIPQSVTSLPNPITISTPTPAVPLPAVPVIPHVPILPIADTKPNSAPGKQQEASITAPQAAKEEPHAVGETVTTAPITSSASNPTSVPPPKVPSSWADLVKSSTPGGNAAKPAVPKVNGSSTTGKTSLGDILKSFDGTKFTAPVLEPRGLVNTGNMCFMNAILQMLMFCGPFYHFLDLLAKNVTHSFKGETPLLDTMVLFLREFRVLGSHSAFQNLAGHKEKEYVEAFGEPFAPEFVYSALREIQRFASMRRGHQHDAEEFLGFLLDELHEELVRVLKKAGGITESSPTASVSSEDGWQEVGPRQKPASTRTIAIHESPITRIFGGQLRTEFKVKTEKNVWLEPYQPLQLDIQSPQVNTIMDALRQLTKPEVINGNFVTAKGPANTATKQVFIENLPPVLILHLKRFQYDSQGGTQKIWKKIGYPLQLEIPREVISQKERPRQATKYKLIGVVYHHGKSASGGHYTVDVLRQDGKNWIRFDDTAIKSVHTNEVKVDVDVKINSLPGKTDIEDDEGWETVGHDVGGAANGSQVYGKDSKVAYILFYQQI